MAWIITGIILSYLAGSIPTAYVFGRLLKGIDIRKFGSGNVGATNALRVLGKGPGITVLALDVLKGFVPVFFIGDLLANKTTLVNPEATRIIIGLCCICGHNWTLFLSFKGGKGMATTLGVLLALSLKTSGLHLVLGIAILTWLIVFLLSRIVSLASIITALGLPLYMAVFRQSLLITCAGIVLAVFVILRHRSNLKRLFEGREPRIF